MSNLSIFEFETQQVRFVGTAEKPEWVAVDLCKILGIKNVSDTLAKFDEEEKGVVTIDTLGGEQSLLTLSEPGLYRLIFLNFPEHLYLLSLKSLPCKDFRE